MPITIHGQLDADFVKERHIQDRIGFLQTVYRRTMLADAFINSPPAPVSSRDGVVHVRSEAELVDGLAIVRHFYEGLPNEYNPNVKVYEFDPSFDEVPIQAHPNFGGPDGESSSLFKKYGGYYDANGNFRFAAKTSSNQSSPRGFAQPDAGGGLRGGGGSVGGGGVQSLEGVEAYLRMGGIWRVIYPYKGDTLPVGLFYGVGTITSTPKDGHRLPDLPAKRNWLKGPPTARWRGNAWEITEEFILSGVGGWIKDIYDGTTESAPS